MRNTATFIQAAELDERGPYQRERRRQLEGAGLYPPRIRFNCRKNVWVREEVEAWERAKAAGASDDTIRALIRRMIAARADGMPQKVAA